jgi:hypothetical protein
MIKNAVFIRRRFFTFSDIAPDATGHSGAAV